MLDTMYKFTKLIPAGNSLQIQSPEYSDPVLQKLLSKDVEFIERNCMFDMRHVWAADQEILPDGREATIVNVGPKIYLLKITFDSFDEIQTGFHKLMEGGR